MSTSVISALGHPDAHEKVRVLTLKAQREGRPLEEIVVQDEEMQIYRPRMTTRQRQILANPTLYTGIASDLAKALES